MEIKQGQKHVIYNNKESQLMQIPIGAELRDGLSPGFYQLRKVPTMMGTKVELIDHEPKIPTSSILVAQEIVDFNYLDELFSDLSKKLHENLNLNRKVGYLLHGKQGSGKTTTMYAMAKKLIDSYDCCVFTVEEKEDFYFLTDMIPKFREVKDFKAVIILDECESELDNYENYFKSLLDGTDSLNDCVFLMSTNYISRIPSTIKDRPSRFKYVLNIDGIEEESVIYEIMKHMNDSLDKDVKLADESIRSYVNDLKGSTLDEIKTKFMEIAFFENNLIQMV